MPGAQRGRRDPSLLVGDSAVEQAHSAQDFRDDSHAEESELDNDTQFLFEGDVVTSNCTLAIDFGDGRTNFVGYKATTKVQPGEAAEDVYARLVTVVNEGVISAVDDVETRLSAWHEQRNVRLNQITGR